LIPTAVARVHRPAVSCLVLGLMWASAAVGPAIADARASLRISKDTLTVSPFADEGSWIDDRQTMVSLEGTEPDDLKKYAVTFDASGLEDLLVKSAQSLVPCDPDGDFVGECDGSEMPQQITVQTPAKASAAGRSGKIRIRRRRTAATHPETGRNEQP